MGVKARGSTGHKESNHTIPGTKLATTVRCAHNDDVRPFDLASIKGTHRSKIIGNPVMERSALLRRSYRIIYSSAAMGSITDFANEVKLSARGLIIGNAKIRQTIY